MCSGSPLGGRKLDFDSANSCSYRNSPNCTHRGRQMLGSAKRTFIRTASWVLSRLAVPLLPRGQVLTGHGASIDTTTPAGKLVFGIFAALAEFERDLISERTKAGLASARARGRRGGAPFKMTAAKVRCRFSFTCRKLTWRCCYIPLPVENSFTCRNPELRRPAGSISQFSD
jgi:hypothetical protein